MSDLPKDVIGMMMEGEGFICRACAEKQGMDDDMAAATPIFNYDEWFPGDICARCDELIEPAAP